MRNTALATTPDDDNVVTFPGPAPGPVRGVDPSAAGAAPRSPRLSELDIGRLFDAHAPYLCRVVHRLTGSREAAEDVVQEVFLLAYNRRHELEDRSGIRTWLYRAAVNHVRHRRRSYSRYQGLMDRYQQHPGHKDKDEGPDEVASRAERGKLVQECVAELSEKLREVFVLYELEELEGNEIADVLDVPVNTVWSRLRLARAAFRSEWSRRVEVEAGR